MPDPQDLERRIRALIVKQHGDSPSRVTPDARIEEDLGITGDDAAELLEAFAAEFGVDMAGLDFHKHFGPEGFGPLQLFYTPKWLKEHDSFPVTVRHLILVAARGRWFSPDRKP